jgi:hypothetical protein
MGKRDGTVKMRQRVRQNKKKERVKRIIANAKAGAAAKPAG